MAKRTKIKGTLAIMLVFIGLNFSSCAMIKLFETSKLKSTPYGVFSETIEDIRGDITIDNFILLCSWDGSQRILIQKTTQNTNIDYKFVNRLDLSQRNLGQQAVIAEMAMRTLMLKTDIADVVTLIDKNPIVTRDNPYGTGLTARTVICSFPISNALLDQLRKCNTLTWQYEASNYTKPEQVPFKGIAAMQEFLK
jgi:hypothetical protein